MNSVDESTWEAKIYNQVSFELQENAKSQKNGELRIAESNHAQSKQRIAKDVILPSSGDSDFENEGAGKNAKAKPNLPIPKKQFAGLKGDDVDEGGKPHYGKTISLIAIIGTVMALQAKSNSNFWSTIWKQACQSMMMSVKFAPIIASATISQYTAMSKGTQYEAEMAKQDGEINLSMFGAAMLGSLAGEMMPSEEASNNVGYTDDETDPNLKPSSEENPAPKSTDENDKPSPSPGLLNDESGTIEGEDLEASDTADDSVNKENATNKQELDWKSKAWGLGKNFIKNLGTAKKTVGNIIGPGLENAAKAKGLADGMTGFFVDSKYKSLIAKTQAEQGQAQALSKEAEQYSDFYNKSFGQADTMAQQAQQSLDYAMNILKSAADTITQTVTSMFRG